MVAVIKVSSSLKNVINYNENKLKQKVAQLIHSMNYGKDTDHLGFTDKIKTLEKLTSLNQQTRLNALHISLNFDPSEKLDTATLSSIADNYMQRIGFGNQPYLVYKHQDAGHPHIHIVSTNIERNGKRISMHNIGRNQSEKARKEIELEYNLTPAESNQEKQASQLRPVNAQKVQYGKAETKRAITNVLDVVLPTYKYASLPELNAVLRQYNVIADRGSEQSRTYKSNGLVYRVLDEQGQKIGAPVKASALYNRPGLKFLNEQFSQNEPLKQPHRKRVRNAIDLSFARQPIQTLEELTTALQKEKIQLVLRQNDKGVIYGMTYVDHQTKCIFNGSDLGKEYSSNRVLQRCNHQQLSHREETLQRKERLIKSTREQQKPVTELNLPRETKLIKELMQLEKEGNLASEFRQDQQKRKRKKIRYS